MHRGTRRVRRSTVTGLVGAVVMLATGVAVPVRPVSASTKRNILFVLADDLDLAEMQYLPEVGSLIAAKGVTFDRYFVSDSLCCPSRTSTLKGQFAHNTGVRSNGGTNGGFRTAYRNGVEAHTIATRLHRAGYRTALFGKYLNGYPAPAGDAYVPPGWDAWASPTGGHPYSEYDYVLNHNGHAESFGSTPSDYGTDVYLRMTERFVERAAARGRPFFAFLSVYAPHEPATPAPPDVDRFAAATAPRTPSYDQADVGAMPVYIRDLPQFTADEEAAIDRLYQRRIESLQAVDRGVADLVATLRATHELRSTYIVFASDNGFHLGQHRLPAGKETPYDTDIHVPLVILGPGIDAGSHVRQMATNTDLAPTFAAMAGARRSARWDGRSLLALAEGHRVPAVRWRQVHLVEHWTAAAEANVPPAGVPEPEDLDQADPGLHPTAITGPEAKPGERLLSDRTLFGRLVRIPDYVGIRTSRYLYVEYVNGDRELYDLATDPDEMQNLAGTDPALEARLAQRLAALRACAGASCRAAERGDPVGG